MSYCIGDKVFVNGSVDGRDFCNEKGRIDLIDKSSYPTHRIVFDNSCVKPWYITESMLTSIKLNTPKFKVGDRVTVSGSNDGKSFCGQIGTIIRTNDRYQPYLVKFDDYSILNGSREVWWVREDQVTAHVDYLAVGTLVKVCGYSFNGDYFSQEGKIFRVNTNDKNYTYQVEFSNGRAPWFQLASLTVIKPSTSTETYKTTWSKNPSQRFGVYKNGRLLSSYITYGEASSVASALNKESCINSYTVQVI